MKKKIGAFLLAGVMLLSMTGCGDEVSKASKKKASDYSKYVELGEYKGIEYTKTVAEVTDDDVQAKLDAFVEGLAETKEVTGRAVQDGDILNIDYVGTMDGVQFDGGTAEGQSLTIGSGSFIDGFEDGLIGHEIGEKVTLDLAFPDPYENNPDFAGKAVTFDVTINSISEKVTPELTDALVTDNTDYDTIDAYKDSIREELKTTNESNAKMQAQSDIFNKVIENSKISGFDEDEVKQLVDDEFAKFKESATAYESYGYSYEDVLASYGYENEEALKEGITEYTKNYLTQKMVIYMIADKEDITITSEDVEALKKEYMTAYSWQTEEEMLNYYGEDFFELSVLSEKVMNFLEDNGVLVDSLEDTTETTTEE